MFYQFVGLIHFSDETQYFLINFVLHLFEVYGRLLLYYLLRFEFVRLFEFSQVCFFVFLDLLVKFFEVSVVVIQLSD